LALVVCIVSLLAVTVTRLSNRHYGNIEDGAALYYNSSLTCFACHGSKAIAPPLAGADSRVRENAAAADERLAQYIAESILAPDEHIVPLYAQGRMPRYNLHSSCPDICSDSISVKQLRDVVAFLMTLR
jgi:mono/diheme cytochrome c family protein